MTYGIHHIHLKSADPKRTADWWVEAFRFTIVNDSERSNGIRFIVCETEDGMRVNISSAARGETLASGVSGLREGLEHLGFHSDNLEQDIERLTALGAKLVGGPMMGSATRVCFMVVPDEIRIELVERPAA